MATGVGYEVFVLMEYCSGHGLLDFMNAHLRDLLSETQILQIASDIGSGLAYMHYQDPPLIHRDLKIENVLISGDGVFKLCDFGSASPILRPPRNAQEYQMLEHDLQNRTTVQYRSPEMVDISRGFPIDEKSDIWAFGVFIYKLCYYTTPFEKGGDLAILNAKFTFPSKPNFSDRLKRLICATLSEDPRNRPNIYAVLKEIYDMRGLKLNLKDVYVSPTSTQHQNSPESPSKAQSSSNSLSTTPSDSSMSLPQNQNQNIPVQRGVVPIIPPKPMETPKIPTVSPMYRGRPQNNVDPAGVQSTQGNLTDPFSATENQVGTDTNFELSDQELDFEKFNAENVTSKYPTIEELTMSLEKQSLNYTPNAPSSTFSSSTPSVAPIATPLPIPSKPGNSYSSKSLVNLSASASASFDPSQPLPSTSPWLGAQSYSNSNVPSISPTPKIQVNYSQASPVQGYTFAQSPPQNQQSNAYVSHASQTVPLNQQQQPYSKPTMVSQGVMTSPVASRSHTPAASKEKRTSRYSSSSTSTSNSSSSDDDAVVDGIPRGRSSYASLKDNSRLSYTPQTSSNQNWNQRQPEEVSKPRPVSMYMQSSDSLLDFGDYESQKPPVPPPHLVLPKTKSSSQLQQKNDVLIEPIQTDEKDKLKSLLTGLSAKSSLMVFDNKDDGYIENSVDFLKALDNDHTGRSRHNRSPSGGGSNRMEEQKRNVSHSKKSSVSLKKIGDALKKFDSTGNRSTSYSRNHHYSDNYHKGNTLSNMKKNRFSYSSDSLGTYGSEADDYSSSGGPSPSYDKFPALGRHPSSGRSSSGARGSSSIHSRIQALMNHRTSPPPVKTASGYGKYTDSNSGSSSGSGDDEFGVPVAHAKSYSGNMVKTHYRRASNSLDLPRDNSIAEPTSRYNVPKIDQKTVQKMKDFSSGGGSTKANSQNEMASDESDEQINMSTSKLSRSKTVDASSSRARRLKRPLEFHHKRQLSTISSASSSTEGSSLSNSSNPSRKPPLKPSKPAHLKSPKRVDSGLSPMTASENTITEASDVQENLPYFDQGEKYSEIQLGKQNSNAAQAQRQSAPSNSTGSNLIDITPSQSPVVGNGNTDDWKDLFNRKYPNVA